MAEEAALAGYIFPYLYDETQAVAKAYRAACTPDLYLFDKNQWLVYRGQLDDSRPGNGIPVTGKDLRARRWMPCSPVSPFRPIRRPASGATSNGNRVTSQIF